MSETLSKNKELILSLRSGYFALYVRSWRAGSKNRLAIRKKGVRTLVENIRADGFSLDSKVSVWEDLEHCEKVGLRPLHELFEEQRGDRPEHTVRIEEPWEDTKKRLFCVVDGMHRMTALEILFREFGEKEGVFDRAPCCVLYNAAKLPPHLKVLMGQEANKKTRCLVGTFQAFSTVHFF